MLTYRPDIDGLRAVAVLSVVLYHLDESLLTGGFVGVDVFFVISGYLITKLISNEYDKHNTFNFKRFYLRRVRRLFPALFATLLLCLLIGGILFSPAHLVALGKSTIAAILSISNVFFWSSTGYFDSQSQLKPLLHTWSLSVEEQFYLLWPALLIGLLSIKKTWLVPAFIVALGIASLILNIWVFSEQVALSEWFGSKDNQAIFDSHSTAFYWLPFRVFEFAIGAILVWLPRVNAQSFRLVAEASFALGLCLIAYSVTQITEETPFPSTTALWPCMGAGLVIWAGPKHRLAQLLSNRVAVAIGLISYSLYLVHWPIIVFYGYAKGGEFNLLEMVAIVTASLIIAALFYQFIEQPFRKPLVKKPDSHAQPNKPFLLGSATAAITLIGIAAHAAASGGWLQRYPEDMLAQLRYQPGDYTEYFWHELYTRETGFSNTGAPKVLVIGDSMAADFVNVLAEGGLDQQIDVATIAIADNCKAVFPLTDNQYQLLFGGAAETCKKQHAKVLENTKLLNQANTIVLASYWWELHWLNYVPSTAQYLRKNTNAKIMVLGLKNQNSDGIWFLNKHIFKPNIADIKTPMNAQAATVNQVLSSRQNNDYTYFDLLDLFCEAGQCQRVTDDGYVIIFDQAHLSKHGAKMLGMRARNSHWFKLLKER